MVWLVRGGVRFTVVVCLMVTVRFVKISDVSRSSRSNAEIVADAARAVLLRSFHHRPGMLPVSSDARLSQVWHDILVRGASDPSFMSAVEFRRLGAVLEHALAVGAISVDDFLSVGVWVGDNLSRLGVGAPLREVPRRVRSSVGRVLEAVAASVPAGRSDAAAVALNILVGVLGERLDASRSGGGLLALSPFPYRAFALLVAAARSSHPSLVRSVDAVAGWIAGGEMSFGVPTL